MRLSIGSSNTLEEQCPRTTQGTYLEGVSEFLQERSGSIPVGDIPRHTVDKGETVPAPASQIDGESTNWRGTCEARVRKRSRRAKRTNPSPSSAW